MQFQTVMQEACYEKVITWMRELYGKFPCARQDVPGLALFMGSALVEVFVFPWGKDDAIINTRSYVVTGTELTPDLMRFLLRENSNMRFGAFGIDEQGDVLFEHTIVGSTCDKVELEASVNAVLEIADDYDDKIVERWGGMRALDRIR
ncbi:YbjN domain-containing protein [Lyngbya sp. CCY1209]|uniref:T3SS (YopN, CesT) and YbjN peptide-binding chaperone 1 n=1 Tax=Lyngbya sp. CCY1209 TaxID=2886103 RepID=UPI002D205FE6|nr:YbjN domain-containing protein [Lyngbya sp. CCY1209]MEB3885820.1 YbjN domain-containing protein [Lyngbya sp. CCY1209]